MPRRPLQITTSLPYHVTARSNNKEWFYVHPRIAWEIFSEKLALSHARYGTVVFAFVLMSNHFHAILMSPSETLGEVMRHLMTEVSKGIQRAVKRTNHVFGSRYAWSILDSAYATAYVYKYVLRNPVRAGLCERVQNYRYSSLTSGLRGGGPPVVDGIGAGWRLVPRDFRTRVQWLNQPTPRELEQLITTGLRRSRFRFARGNSSVNAMRELEGAYGVGSGSALLCDRDLFGPEGD